MQIVGTSVPRKEGIAKVLGQSVYTADMSVEHCLYGRTVRSTVPHATIKQIPRQVSTRSTCSNRRRSIRHPDFSVRNQTSMFQRTQ